MHDCYIKAKDAKRDEIAAQVKAFQESGGKVQVVSSDQYDKTADSAYSNYKRRADKRAGKAI